MNMQTVAGKTVLITGAAMGMGKLYARLAVSEQARAVVLWDINAAELEKTVAELRTQAGAQGAKIYSYVVDVSKLPAITEAAGRVKADVGSVDVLLNNAGIVVGRMFWEHSHEQIERTLAINTTAPMHIALEFLPGMLAASGECRIVNIASAAGLIANPRMSVYCSSKWGVIGWSDSVRLELEQQGKTHVRVTTVCPSYISTGMFDGVKAPLMTPILTPEYVVDKVWKAMKTGRPLLRMPFTVIIVGLARGLLPPRVFDFVVGKLFGVYETMEAFKGHAPAKS